jgi:hypothetical protein
VLLAAHERPLWAATTVGLAIANKQWALLALGPVLLCTRADRRLLVLAWAGAVIAAVMAPLALVSSGGFLANSRGAAAPGATIFQPWQAWWFLGHHGTLVHGLFGGAKPGYRIGPSWVGEVSHPAILLAGLGVSVGLWPRTRRSRSSGRLTERDALLALAVVLLLRCLLDTWDVVYYPLPFVIALVAWESSAPSRRPPVLALSASTLAWITFKWSPAHLSPDAQAALFLCWTLPLGALLALALRGSSSAAALVDRRQGLREARESLVPLLADHG